MRIGLVFSGCHPRGGVERVIWEAAIHLCRRHKVTVIAGESDPLPEDVSLLTVEYRRGSPLEPLRFRAAAARAMEGKSFDVVVSFGANCPPGEVLVVQSVHRAWLKRGTSVRIGRVPIPALTRRVLPRHRVMLLAETQLFRRAPSATVVAVSEGVAEDLEHYYHVPSSLIRVIPNGFSPSQCSAERRRELRPVWRERLGLSDSDIALLLVANEWHRKGLGTVLRAMDRVGDSRLQLLLVGRQEPTQYDGLIERLGLRSRVRWFGVASDVAEYHAAADLFVMPTTYEPFGNVIVEALASGLPVITSALAGAASAVQDGHNGRLLDDPTDDNELANDLASALQADTLDRWSVAAADSVARFQWSLVMDQFEMAIVERAGQRAR
jgi:UDP-glucose:(heptosyl)LPS alpha-1,3-glucosyltransferase